MCVYVCVYVCMWVCIYVCMHACMCDISNRKITRQHEQQQGKGARWIRKDVGEGAAPPPQGPS